MSNNVFLIVYIVVIVGMMYVLFIRPQRKQQREQKNLLDSIAVGDYVVTTSGFYGVILDVSDDDVVVEFGNNKNCRIPMQKNAIVDVEKQDE